MTSSTTVGPTSDTSDVPFDEAGLRAIRVGSDPKVACLPPPPTRSPVESSLSLTDLEGESIINGAVDGYRR